MILSDAQNRARTYERLYFSKRELIDYLALLPVRWNQNRKRNMIFTGPFTAAIKVMRTSLISEDDIQYYWLELFALVDELRAANELRKDAQEHPKLGTLAELAQNNLRKSIIQPRLISELDAMKAILNRARQATAYGAMNEG